MDTILSFIPSKTFAQNFIRMKNTVLAEVSSKEARKAFLVKIRNKIVTNYNDIANVKFLRVSWKNNLWKQG